MRTARIAIAAGWAVTLVLLPGAARGQIPLGPREQVVWHWFGECTGRDSMAVEITLDGAVLYGATFPICQRRRADIKPEPQQRVLEFHFAALPQRFRAQFRADRPVSIQGSIWESEREGQAIVLGIQFATADQVLLNTTHIARPASASRSYRVRGLVITTRPVRRLARPSPERAP